MNIGQVLELSVWLTGEESVAMIERYKTDLCDGFRETCETRNVRTSPIIFTEKKPGEDRVPPVPKHISGANVRLLLGEAMIVEIIEPLKVNSFLGDLDKVDLERLRRMTQATARQYGAELSDMEADVIIEGLGPEAAYAAVKQAVDSKSLH